MKPNVHAGRLERRVRRVVSVTIPGVHGFCSFYPFGAIRGKPLLRPTALFIGEQTADCRLRSESALRVTGYGFLVRQEITLGELV